MSGMYLSVDVPGWVRVWNVAAKRTSPGRYYLDQETGVRFTGVVTFLNVEPAAGSVLAGVAVPVTAEELAAYDRRELNYDRVQVTSVAALDAPAWMYVGRPDSVAYFNECSQVGTAVISAQYRSTVESAAVTLGPDFYRRYVASTRAPTVPVKTLEFVNTDY